MSPYGLLTLCLSTINNVSQIYLMLVLSAVRLSASRETLTRCPIKHEMFNEPQVSLSGVACTKKVQATAKVIEIDMCLIVKHVCSYAVRGV